MLAYQLGDENAFRELYSRHSNRVFGFLRSKVRDDVKARDIFQATFLKLHNSRAKYNPTFPFTPWLFTICRNELLDALKKEKRSIEDSVAQVPEQPNMVPESQADLAILNTSQQQALKMRFGDNSSFEEIAQALNTSPANARQIVSRAVRALRSLYGKK